MGMMPATGSLRCSTLAGLLVLSVVLPPITPRTGRAEEAAKPACVINFIGHVTTDEMTRVILHADTTSAPDAFSAPPPPVPSRAPRRLGCAS